jgi:hypothetical protein
VAGLLALAACSSSSTPTVLPPSPVGSAATATVPPHEAGCAWYSPVQGAAVVNVTARGPGCIDGSVLRTLVADTDRKWISESWIPGSFGTLLAQLTRAGTTVEVWFTGPRPSPDKTGSQTSPPAPTLAGRIAQDLQDQGWAPTTASET